jgi:hypothetical protein
MNRTTSAGQPAPVTPSRDTAAQESTANRPAGVIPSGTTLELAAATRVCSTTSENGDRFPATVVVPVTGTGGATVPVGASATLQVVRLPPPTFIGVRPDSLTVGGRTYPVKDAEATVHQREFTAGAGQSGVGVGACIPTGGRITVRLRAPVEFGRAA